MLTKNTYRNTVIKESQEAVMEEFVDNVKILINALGYKLLEPFAQVNSSTATVDDELLYITSGSVNATGKVTAEGFVVFAGATVKQTPAKSLNSGMQKLRDNLINSNKVKEFTTTEDILFSSSSAAAAFITGYSVSGPEKWKTKDDRTLKEIEEKETIK